MNNIKSKNNVFLSIVTINLNNASGLFDTIYSIKKQTLRSCFQYIVIDGDSKDKSIDVINNNKTFLNKLIIQKDQGIYYAMNKGIDEAIGQYTLFLNSGDTLHNNSTIEEFYNEHINYLRKNRNNPISYYSDYVTEDGTTVFCKDLSDIWKGMICSHQSIAIETNFLKKNKFDTNLEIAADYKNILQAYMTSRAFHKIDTKIAVIENVKTSSNSVKRGLERWLINLQVFNKDDQIKELINNHYSKLLFSENTDLNLENLLQIKAYYKQKLKDKENKILFLNRELVDAKNSHITYPDFESGFTENMDNSSIEIQRNIIFLISMPRSGSTLLQRLLESSKDISSTSEPWIMLPILSLYDPNIIEASYDQRVNIKAFESLLSEINAPLNFLENAQKKYINTIYSSILKNFNSKYFLDKTPRYIHIIDKLIKLMPNAKYIVLLRRPESIINSYASTWTNNNFKNVLKNKHFVNDFKNGFRDLYKFASSNFSNKHIINYEKLVTNKNEELNKIGKYLNLDLSQTFIENSEMALKRAMGDPKSINRNKTVFNASISAWEKNINSNNISDFLNLIDLVSENVFKYNNYSKNEAKLYIKNLIKAKPILQNYAEKKSNQTIGIIITCYNNEKDIIKALDSVLSQTRVPDKIVVIDDKSKDNSVNLIKEYIKRNNIQNKTNLIINKSNYGIGKSRDIAIKECNTDYITTLDGDDIIKSKKIEFEFKAIKKNNALIAFSDIDLAFEDRNVIQDTSKYNQKGQSELIQYLLSRSQPVPRDMLIRKDCYIEVKGFIHGFNLYEDWLLKQKLTKFSGKNGWVHSGTVGTIYNRKNPGLSQRSIIQLIWYQIQVVFINKSIISNDFKNYNYLAQNFLVLLKRKTLPNFSNYLELIINNLESPKKLKDFLTINRNDLLTKAINNKEYNFEDQEIIIYIEDYFAPKVI